VQLGGPTFLANIGTQQFTAQYVSRQYPLVLQQAGRRQNRGLRNEEGKVMEVDCWENEAATLSIGVEFCVWMGAF